ncbi:fam-b protein [Plasmodium chabaudi adami]|uniref:Fam-b protein n=1 Tax=Plasmodium chabaudi adami TaxID=5826 RepID=A0A1C6Y7K9_PLACE|nr:fam-b protein [Plasmodium chabaudi adami]
MQVIHYSLLLLIIFYYSFRIYMFYINLILMFRVSELYFVNESIYLERAAINFRNSRMLADIDNQLNLNKLYQSPLSRANQFNGYNDADKKIANLQNIIDPHIEKDKENNTLLDLDNIDEEKKKLIYELRKEIEEEQKKFASSRNNRLAMYSIQNRSITKMDDNNYISEQNNYNLENEGNGFEAKDDHFEAKDNEIISRDNYMESKNNGKFKKILRVMGIIATGLAIILSGGLILIIIPLCTRGSSEESMKRRGLCGLYTKKSKK